MSEKTETTTPWPFAPGQIVRDSGEGDDAAWLDAAPVGTVVRDAEADTWTKSGRPVNGSWFLNGGRGGAGATFVASQGPLTVVSVPGQTTTLHACTVDETAGGAGLSPEARLAGAISNRRRTPWARTPTRSPTTTPAATATSQSATPWEMSSTTLTERPRLRQTSTTRSTTHEQQLQRR